LKKIQVQGSRGLHGWVVEPEDLHRYFEDMRLAWGNLPPVATGARIAYTPADGGPVCIVVPNEHFLSLLFKGGVIRHMRVIDDLGANGIPVFEGSGKILGPMTEKEAIEFIAWKDIPRGVNHIAFIDESAIPVDRTFRNAWQLAA
jgi:hypothetical protein